MKIVVVAAALLVLPLVALRGRTLVRCYTAIGGLWLFAALLRLRLPDFDPYLGGVTVAVLTVALFALFLARGDDVRWSANRAALIAAIVYACTIPAMLRTPIDGDEPFYLLVTESLAHDGDLDLANQYRALATSETGRRDLAPQPGDPRGPHGEQYSRQEPFLALLMLPGYALAGLYGALATIALFGVLLVRSTIRWMEDEGVSDDAARAVFPLFAFAPPVLFYATRIWPEVPAAFCFVEAMRGVRNQRIKRWLPALFGLVMLKLRFVLVAIGVVASTLRRTRARLVALAVVVIPLFVMWLISGRATNVHAWSEILPTTPMKYAIGIAGLLADGMSGLAFQAPFYLFGLFALTRWKDTPRGFRLGMLASLLYILYLLPRPEWFGGWAPPLRYVVFVMPVLALGIASQWEHVSRGALTVVSLWTIGLTMHGLAFPWRLFHIANGENALGEWLSVLMRADVSRFFPSFIRINHAAWIGAGAVVLLAFALRRMRNDLAVPLFALAVAAGFTYAQQPAPRVEFEDIHVEHHGGTLYPELYTVMRVTYRGGWTLNAGDSLTFLARGGPSTLHYITGPGATIELAGRAYHLPSAPAYTTARVVIPHAGRVTLRCLEGAVNLDRMDEDR
jgi:hypothetical protein